MYNKKNWNFPAQLVITTLSALLVASLTIAQVKAPQITPLSPNAAALWKYSELPVNMYTGIPSIAIPIYEIKSGNLSVPISLSYHAGGIRYEEQASWVGLGWNINPGNINRNMRGVPDDFNGNDTLEQTQKMKRQVTIFYLLLDRSLPI